MSEIQMIELSRLNDNSTQTRENLREGAIQEYAEQINAGNVLDPALVFYDGNRYWLAAGFHRREAYRLAGRDRMPCLVRQGGRWDAIEAGMKDNHQHRGERLTRADKQHNVRLVLREQPGLSDRAIAEICQVSDKTVSVRRSEMESTAEIPQLKDRTGQDGRTRRSPVLIAQEAAWTQFPLPELSENCSYSAIGTDDNFANIDPHPDAIGYCFVSVITGIHSSQPQQYFDMRGGRLERNVIETKLRRLGFAPAEPWEIEQSSGELPDYVPSQEERWAIERKSREHFDRTGRWPWQESGPAVARA